MSQKPSQRRRTYTQTFEDGIHRVTETVKAPTRADAQAFRERLCLAADSLARLIAEASADVRHPLETGARDITTLKNAILSKLAPWCHQPHEAEQMAVWAFRLGELLTDAKWRLRLGSHVRRGIKQSVDGRHAGQQDKETKYTRDNERFDKAIEAHLKTHPQATSWQLAKHLYPWKVDGEVATLEALHQRIKRRRTQK